MGWSTLTGANQPAKQDESSARTEQLAPSPSLTPAPTPPSATSPTNKFVAYGGYDPDPCYHAKDHDAADLCAQWRSAIAAEKTAHEARRATSWAIVATFLSAATVIGLIITILQTNGALGEARRGNRLNLLFERRSRREARAAAVDQSISLGIANRNAEAAVDAAKSAREAIRTERAWLCYDRVSQASFTNSEIDGRTVNDGYMFSPVWINVGRTPAIRVSIRTEFKLVGFSDPLPSFGNSVQASSSPLVYATLGPSMVMKTNEVILDDDQWVSLKTRTHKLFIYCQVVYLDVFSNSDQVSERHYSEICLEVIHRGGTISIDGKKGHAFYIRQVAPQNKVT